MLTAARVLSRKAFEVSSLTSDLNGVRKYSQFLKNVSMTYQLVYHVRKMRNISVTLDERKTWNVSSVVNDHIFCS